MSEVDYEKLRRLFMEHEYRPFAGGYSCSCGWKGSSQSEHLASVTKEFLQEQVAQSFGNLCQHTLGRQHGDYRYCTKRGCNFWLKVS